MNKGLRSTVLALALAASAVPLLQGCFPVVAGGVGAGARMKASNGKPARPSRRSWATWCT